MFQRFQFVWFFTGDMRIFTFCTLARFCSNQASMYFFKVNCGSQNVWNLLKVNSNDTRCHWRSGAFIFKFEQKIYTSLWLSIFDFEQVNAN